MVMLFGAFRPGEALVASTKDRSFRALLMGDMSICCDYNLLHLQRSKTDQMGRVPKLDWVVHRNFIFVLRWPSIVTWTYGLL